MGCDVIEGFVLAQVVCEQDLVWLGEEWQGVELEPELVGALLFLSVDARLDLTWLLYWGGGL